MGIQRSDRHKRLSTGAQRRTHRKKRAFALARPFSNTKIGDPKIKSVRTRGGNSKQRALRINKGVFTLKSCNLKYELNFNTIMYHPSSTELMRTNTLTKGAVVKLVDVQKMGLTDQTIAVDNSKINDLKRDNVFWDNMSKGNVYGLIQTRPGQEGKADGCILQGEELAFYMARFKKGKAK